jgi:KTSC domain
MTQTVPLSSSLLAVVAYSTRATLDLTFRNGAVYRYFDVPRAVFHRLIAAESKGVSFNQTIRNRFPYRRLA